MIPLPPTLKIVLLVVVVGLVAALKELGVLVPALTCLGPVVSVLAIVEAYLTTPPSPPKPPAGLAVLAFGCALLAMLPIVACSPATVVAATPAIATTAACIITTSAEDVQSGMPAVNVVEDVIAKCGTDAASIATILDAEARAQTIAGGKLGDVSAAAKAKGK